MSVSQSHTRRSFLVRALAVGLLLGAPRPAVAEERDAVLQFFDGSVLQGEMISLTPGQDLVWKHPYADGPVRFSLSNVAWVRFLGPHGAPESRATPKHHVTFRNGDQVFGEVTSIDETHVSIANGTSHPVRTVREEVESIRNLPKTFTIVREGTATLEDWTVTLKPVATLIVNNVAVQKTQHGWAAHNGKFEIEGAGILGTRLHQQKPTSVSFDLGWTGAFSLVVGFFAAEVNLDNYTSYTCHVRLDLGTVSAQTLTDQRRATTLGGQSVPEMLKKSSVHFEARVDPNTQKIEAFIDGELVKVWTDRSQWELMGDALILSSVRSDSNLAISNLRVATWEGTYLEVPVRETRDEQDWLYLSNQDEVLGSVLALTDGRVEIESPVAGLSVPIERIAYLQFETDGALPDAGPANGVQARLRGGGKMTFVPQHWDPEKVTGFSERYGDLTFSPSSIEELRFNLDRGGRVSTAFDASQSVLWEVEAPEDE